MSEQKSMKRRLARRARREFAATFFAWLMLSPVLVLGVDKPDFKPGYNFYSPQDDAQVGRESSAQVNKQLPFLNDAEAQRYINGLGKWPELSGASTGTNVRRRRLNPQDFLNYQIPLPSRETQMTLREVRAEVDALKRLQAETAAELDALLPAILDKAFKGEL